MRFNPLRTLAGRLIMVTIVAIAISQIVAFALFTNERGHSIGRIAEANVAERIASVYDRLHPLDATQQAEAARASSDFGMRFSIVARGGSNPGLDAGGRIAHAVSEQLGGVETRASARQLAIDWPAHLHMMRDAEGGLRQRPPRADGAPPTGPPEFTHHGPPGDDGHREVTEVVVDTLLSPGHWLRARAYLPAPRPIPASIWFAALVSMLATSLGAVLISRQIGKPLADLANAADRLGSGETGVAAPVSGPEDVRRASTAFNSMAERLGRQLNRQRHMLWALSHDLRTPITALRLRAELIEDESARQRLLGPLAEMETLTEQALSLARAGASEEKRETVDLAEIARTLCGELQELGTNVRAEAEAPVMVECRPSEIARALRNLAENAAKYGGGGVMKVTRNGEGDAVVEVSDDGPGLPPETLARVTEPFFRADTARSESNGAGLGLAIAQAIADGHGGKLLLENRAPHGLSAKLILPG